MSAALDGTVLGLGEAVLDTVHGPFVAHRFQNLSTGAPVLALARGSVCGSETLLARVHSSCVTSEAYRGCDCDCAGQLDGALAAIARAGRGILFYVMQEGRGAGFAAKARDRMLVQASRNRLTTFEAYAAMGIPADQRRYGEVAAVCRLLGIAGPLRLLSNNPEKVAALVADGVAVAGTVPLAFAASPYSAHYLAAKSNAGHALGASSGALPPATLPEPVEAFAPHALPGVPRVLRLASYLLPVGEPEPAWFRLHLYFDVDARCERVVLTYRQANARGPVLVRVQAEALLERFPVRVPRRRAEWLAAAARIVAHGTGAVLFTHVLDAEEGEAPPEAAALALLAAHVDGGGARVLAVGERPTEVESQLAAVLAARGVTAGPPVLLGD